MLENSSHLSDFDEQVLSSDESAPYSPQRSGIDHQVQMGKNSPHLSQFDRQVQMERVKEIRFVIIIAEEISIMLRKLI